MEREKRSSSESRKVSAQPAGHHGKRKKPLSSRQKFLRAAVIVLVLGLGLVLAYGALFVRPSLPGEAEGSQNEELDWGDGVRPRASGARKSDDFYTVLILGRDTGGGGNTDTMLLASYDVTNQKATVMSIPRDTMVNVSWDVKKINSVYNSCGRGDKGIQGLYREIAQLVGFEPDYQVVVEWEAVGKIVDAIGGVYFDVPYTMDYHDPLQNLVIEQEKGYRLLSGEDAMEVIRWRKNDRSSPYGYHNGIGDSGRMEVQQSFLKAVIRQMMQPANVLNIGKIAKVFQENVSTDLSFQNILWFGKQAFSGGLSIDDVTFLTMPWKGAEAWSRYYHRYLEYVIPVPDKLLEIVNNQLSPFQETFTLSDLDIMSVNADGSLRSTTGHLEDSRAAQAPTSSVPSSGGTQTEKPVPSAPGTAEPEPTVPDTGSDAGPGAEPPETAEPEPSTPDTPVQPPAQEDPSAETPQPEAPPPGTAEEPAGTISPADA